MELLVLLAFMFVLVGLVIGFRLAAGLTLLAIFGGIWLIVYIAMLP